MGKYFLRSFRASSRYEKVEKVSYGGVELNSIYVVAAKSQPKRKDLSMASTHALYMAGACLSSRGIGVMNHASFVPLRSVSLRLAHVVTVSDWTTVW